MLRAGICALLLFSAHPARADSDGYYCLGPNYLAFQFGTLGPPLAPYKLYLVRVGGPAGIGALDSLSMPAFQTNGMVCDAHTVRLLARNALYTVHLDSMARPLRFTAAPLAAGDVPAEFIGRDANLSTLNRAVNEFRVDRVPILRDAAGHSFSLEVSADPTAVRPCDPDVRARIVENDAAGRQVRERWLPRGLPDPPGCVAGTPAPALATPVHPSAPPDGMYVQAAMTAHLGEICVDVPPGLVDWSTLAKATLGEKTVTSPGVDSLRAHYNRMFQTSELGLSVSASASWTSEVVRTDSSDARAYAVTVDGKRYQFNRGQFRTTALRGTLVIRGPGGDVFLLVSRSDDSTCGNQYELFAVERGTLHLLRTNDYDCDV